MLCKECPNFSPTGQICKFGKVNPPNVLLAMTQTTDRGIDSICALSDTKMKAAVRLTMSGVNIKDLTL